MSQCKSITIEEDETNIRLDSLISKRFSDHSRNYIQYLFEEGLIRSKNVILKKNARPKVGDVIEITLKQLPEVKLTPEDIALDILYEDDDLIICNKPAAMVTHPAAGSLTNTFAGALLFYLKSLPPSDDPLRPGIVHRLDKDTSGVIVAAKTTRALPAMQQLFAGREVKKSYIAICHGTLNSCTVNAPIGRHPKNRQLMAILENGKEALTDFTLLEKKNGFSLIQAEPYTGRTHQIRVHAKHVNHPIVGDTIYGTKKNTIKRHLLHAQKISFLHPFKKIVVEISAPCPADFKEFWDQL
jgi:23S rRNA pseudouridine1911/1915/1917 synthase